MDQRPVFNDFGDTITHYSNRLNIASQQLNDAFKNLQEMEILAADGWKSRGGEATISKSQELRHEIKNADQSIDSALMALQGLSRAIQNEIARRIAEWENEQREKAAREAAELLAQKLQ